MKVTSKNYDGKLYIRIGRKYISLEQTVEYFESLEKEKCELLGIIQKKDELIKNLICCANCKHGTQGDYDCFENCGSCHATDCECEIKSPTKNSFGKYHDWDDKCDKWELADENN